MMQNDSVYLAWQLNTPIGTITIGHEDSRIWGEQSLKALYIHRLAIVQAVHGQGVGKQIMDWAVEEAKTQDISLLRLDCEADNSGLCSYYESLGFLPHSGQS